MNPFPLNQFKKVIPRHILDRGWDYFETDRILEISTQTDSIKAMVEGGEVYEVHIFLDKDQLVLDTDCTCPYDQGEHCKHITAVFYALEQSKGPSKSSSLKQAPLQKSKEYRKSHSNLPSCNQKPDWKRDILERTTFPNV